MQVVFDVEDGGELVAAIATRAAYQSRLLTVRDVAGLTAADVLRPETADALKHGYFECLQTGAPHSYEEFIDIDDRETWWMTTLSPQLGSDGRFRRLLATFLRVDFVQGTERALRRSEANFRALIEHSPDAMLVSRADGTIVFCNHTAATLLGAAHASDVRARRLDEFIAPSGRSAFVARLRSVLAGGPPEPAKEVELSRLDGGTVSVESAAMPLLFDGEQGLLLVARDVTERKQMQSQLALADRMIALGTIAAGVAHEINNPLTYIHGNITFALEELRSDAAADLIDAGMRKELIRALGDAVEGTDRVRRIVLDMKSLTYTSDDERKAVAVDRALDAALKIADRELRHRARLVRTQGHPPPVRANESRLVQVFLNLLLNAAHAIADGAPEANEILVSSGVEHNLVIVEIRDSGTGIADEHLTRLFDPFFTTKPIGTGMGLGLSISQRAIADLGGRISVRSELGKGSVFRVEIPAGADSVAPKKKSDAPGQLRRRILLVDDDELVGRAIARMIQREHSVTFVSHAKEALELLASGKPYDVILCDLMMPEMTGMEFFEALSRRLPEMASKVAFMSGGAFTPAAAQFLAAIDNPRLDKPLDPKRFRATIASLCGDAVEDE
jgi:PAS domain S-box-containing protein